MNRRVALALLLAVSVAAGSAIAGTWRVEQDGSGQFTTLQPAVDVAASGDTILIGPGWYKDLHWVDHFGSPIQVAAYWLDARDLVFLGAGADQVAVGPSTFAPVRDGPVGIFNERRDGATTTVRGMRFVNLYSGIVGADVQVGDCVVEGGRHGVIGHGVYNRVSDCQFVNVSDISAGFYGCEIAEVTRCELSAYVYFGDTAIGNLRDSIASGRALSYHYNSGGVVENNVAECFTGDMSWPCVVVTGAGHVTVINNVIAGGNIGVSVSDPGASAVLQGNVMRGHDYHNVVLKLGATIIASGNDFQKAAGSDRYLVWCWYYPDGLEPIVINMENNYWGYAYADLIERYIWDHNDDPNLMVLIDYDPFAGGSVPAKEESWGSLKAMFLDP